MPMVNPIESANGEHGPGCSTKIIEVGMDHHGGRKIRVSAS